MNPRFAASWPRMACCGLLFLGFAGIAAAQGGKPTVHFAGIAYTGAADQAGTRAPYTQAAISSRGDLALNAQLLQALSDRPPANFMVEAGTLASLDGTGSAVAMAVAIDRETVVVEPLAGQYKLLFELAGQALFFDFEERQVLFSYPLTLQRIELLPEPPSEARKQQIAHDILFDGRASGLPLALAEELAGLTLPSASARRLQITSVHLPDALAQRLPASVDGDLIGHEFSKILAARLRLPLLPYQSGQAIAGAMSARFADGSVYNLSIPDADYTIALEISDFREKTLKQTPAFRQQLYGAFFDVRVEEPLSAQVFFDQPLRQGATKTIPASQDRVDTGAAYYETLLAGLSSLAVASAGENNDWAREQPGGRLFNKQLKSLKELIDQCR
ncbi:hypothetical protein [Novilysobacter spongiicola]|uniref:Uncharacterized protein n=1 Tax=Lysobacter spongiicola DSM 21749 TaxID=1122188 RepID=A0A1T4NBU1_9GAMM|nr:hypothetical protein [Lysobacter spongiicola]SJZ76575.1 hypothetical protein SAMN02745674_00818 [Lysobacter spongiicola DSM 21749]